MKQLKQSEVRHKMKWWNRSWNPVTGCTKCSEGCDHCFAEALVEKRKKAEKSISFDVRINQKQLNKKINDDKEFIVVANQSDLFHPFVDEETLDRIFFRMDKDKSKRFAILTKRSAYMKDYFENTENEHDFDRMIFGVTVETNKRKYRIDDLIGCEKIKNRFICLEPLLEEVSISEYLSTGKIDWVVVGCETGENARECKIEWIEKIISECEQYNVPIFVNNININGKIQDDLSGFKTIKREFYKIFKP